MTNPYLLFHHCCHWFCSWYTPVYLQCPLTLRHFLSTLNYCPQKALSKNLIFTWTVLCMLSQWNHMLNPSVCFIHVWSIKICASDISNVCLYFFNLFFLLRFKTFTYDFISLLAHIICQKWQFCTYFCSLNTLHILNVRF